MSESQLRSGSPTATLPPPPPYHPLLPGALHAWSPSRSRVGETCHYRASPPSHSPAHRPKWPSPPPPHHTPAPKPASRSSIPAARAATSDLRNAERRLRCMAATAHSPEPRRHSTCLVPASPEHPKSAEWLPCSSASVPMEALPSWKNAYEIHGSHIFHWPPNDLPPPP